MIANLSKNVGNFQLNAWKWRIQKDLVKDVMIVLLLALVIGGSSLVGLGTSRIAVDPLILKMRYMLVFPCLLLMVFISFLRGWAFPKRNLPVLFIWFLFAFAVMISSMVNSDEKLLIDGLWYLFVTPLVFFIAIPNLIKRNAILILALAILMGNMPYIIASLISSPINIAYAYKGVFANPNQMGVTAATLSSALFIILNATLCARKSYWKVLANVFLLIGALALILLSCSRTGLLAFIAMFFVFLGYWLVIKKNLFVFLKKTFLTILLVVLLIFLYKNNFYSIINGMVLKINAKIESGDLLSGREVLWGSVLEDMRLWGHGSNYFYGFEFGAHNSIICILGENGVIAALLIICFALLSVAYAFYYAKSNIKRDYYALGPLIILICFWSISMGETLFGLLGRGLTIAHMVSVGIILLKPISSCQQCSVKPMVYHNS